MRKDTKDLRGGYRGFAAAVIVASLAVFGCSMNRTPGDGEPSMTPPIMPSATPGSSSGTVNPPMASAMDVSLSVERANESAAIMAAHQREHFLGYINPVGPQPTPPDQIPPSGQVIPPSMYANPESTVNASISSPPNPVITSGTGGDAVFLAAPATTATPTAAAATIAGTTNFSTLTPTLAAAATPTPTQAANPRLGTQSSTPASTTTTASATTAPSRAVASGPVIVPIRVVTGANGTVMVTNVPSTPMVIKSK